MSEAEKTAGGAGGETTSSQEKSNASAVTPPEAKTPPAASAKDGASKAPEAKTAEKPAPAEKSAPKALGADDELPEDGELFQLSRQALAKRLDRHTKRELRERFGTDDFDTIKAKLDAAEKYEQEREEKRRAALTREQRLKEDKAKAEARAQEAETKLQEERDRIEVREVDHTVRSILPKFIRDDKASMKFATFELKQYVLGLDDDEVGDPEKVVEEWAQKFVEEYPQFAREGAAPQAKEVPLDTGTRPQRPEPLKGGTEKDPRPGRPNSMTRAEFAAYKRRLGLSGG